MNTICVYCGASKGFLQEYSDAAEALGVEMARRNLGLVYGGGSVGLMGKVSSAVHTSGGTVLGIIPKELEPAEISGLTPGKVMVTLDLHERKKNMFRLSDAFIALPGGFGTLEELLEMITWQQLGFHSKPIGILNVSGFFDSLLRFFSEAVQAGFVSRQAEQALLVSRNPSDLLEKLSSFHLSNQKR